MPRKKLRKAVDSVKADKTGTGGDGKEGIANNEKHVETGEEGNLVQVEIGEDNKGANLEQGNTQLIVIIDNRAAEQEIETGKVNDNADGGDSTVGKHQKENLKQETKTDGTNTKVNVNMETETSSKEKDIAELATRADDVDNGAQTSLDSAEDEEYLEDVRVCDTCGDVGQEHNLVNCHRCDSGAEHIYCMREKLEVVPEDPWTCFTCIQKDRERERAQRVSSLRNSNKDVVQEKQQKQEVSSSLERKDEVSPKNVVSEVVEQKGKEDGETNNVISNKGAEENKDTPLKRKADVLPSPVKPQPNKLLKTASSKTLSPKPGIGVNGKQAPQPLTKTGAPVNGKRVPPPSPKVTNAKGLPEKEKVNPAVPKKTVQPLSKPANGKPNVSKSSIPTPKPAKHGALDVAAIQAMQESLLKSSKPKAPQAKKEDPLARTTATTKWKDIYMSIPDSGKDEKATMKNVSQAKQTEDVHGKTELLKPTLSKASSFKQAEDGHGKSDLLKPTVPRTSSFKQTEDVHGKTDSLKPTLSKASSIKQTEDVHGKIDSSKPTLSKTNSFKETKAAEDVPEYAAQRKCYKCNGFGHSVLYCPSGAMKLLTPFLDSRQSDTQSPLPRLPLPSPLPGLLPTPTKALPTALQSSRPLSTQVPVAVTSTSLQLGVTKAPSAQLQTTPAATPSPLRNEEGRPETKENPIAPPKTVSNNEKIADNEDLPPGYAAHNLDEELSSRRKDRSSRERDRSPDWKRRERDRYHRSGRDKERRSRRPYRRSRSRSSERKRDRRRERSKSRSRTPPRRHDPGRTRYRSSSPSRSDSSDGQRKIRSKSRSPSRRHDRRRSPSEPRRKHSTRHRRSRSRSPGRRRERSRSKSRSRSPTRSPRKSVEPVYHNFLSVEPATAEQEILPAPDLNLVPEIYENPKGGLNLELVPPTDHSIELSLAVPQYRQMGNSWVKVAEEEKDSVKDWALNLGL